MPAIADVSVRVGRAEISVRGPDPARFAAAAQRALTAALEQLVIETSKSLHDFKQRISQWADDGLYPIHGPRGEPPLGRYSLPEKLQAPAEGTR
jgi:hypothetical protein